jgi:hypothetical protein
MLHVHFHFHERALLPLAGPAGQISLMANDLYSGGRGGRKKGWTQKRRQWAWLSLADLSTQDLWIARGVIAGFLKVVPWQGSLLDRSYQVLKASSVHQLSSVLMMIGSQW